MLLFFFPPSDLNLTNWNYILSIRYLCQALKWQLICILKLLETCFSEKPIGCRNNCRGRIKSGRTWWSLPWSSSPCKQVKQILRKQGLGAGGDGGEEVKKYLSSDSFTAFWHSLLVGHWNQSFPSSETVVPGTTFPSALCIYVRLCD